MYNFNTGCICKLLAVFLALIAGVVGGVLLFFFTPATNIGFIILIVISAILAVIATVLALYIANGNASPTLTRCFCEFAVFLIVTALLAITFLIVILALGGILTILATAILGAFAVFFSAAALLSFICFLVCLIRNSCSRGC